VSHSCCCPCCIVYGPSPWRDETRELTEISNMVSKAVTEFRQIVEAEDYANFPEQPQPFLPAVCEDES
jgi:hypothetical protein